MAAAPHFQSTSDQNGGTDRVELSFLFDSSGDRVGSFGRQEHNDGTSDLATPKPIVVWCDGWQFAKVATRLTPQSLLVVEGKPLATIGQDGKPRLVVVCTSLKIATFRSSLSWSSSKARLGICWASIFGGILLLQFLLPKFMPPGLLPLAILLGGMRLVEGLGFVPDRFRTAMRGCLVKILIFAAVVIALWLFVQFSYFSTTRFR
ncbi:MAG TPA: hypothetical protein VH186_03610 [Chloroflexia bacterium]|nr:hypothetical protein [Chloroflexia bacterium]